MALRKMTLLLHVLVMYLLLTSSLILQTSAHPASKRGEEITVEEFLSGRENVKLIEEVLSGMERLLAEHLFKLYNKINSLTQVSDYLIKEGDDMAVSRGRRGDMSDRCPAGFMAVPGDRNCYYFSTYKLPWQLARETCLQLGPNINMLSIETTKKQFIVTHLIQSNTETKNVKKWWTSGRGTGLDWAWYLRLAIDPFFFKFFNDNNDELERDSDSCLILDSDSYYKWKRVRCSGGRGSNRGRGETDQSNLPAHHFICQTAALEPSSIEVEEADESTVDIDSIKSNFHTITSSVVQSSTTERNALPNAPPNVNQDKL